MSLWGIGSHSREQLRGVIKGQKHTYKPLGTGREKRQGITPASLFLLPKINLT